VKEHLIQLVLVKGGAIMCQAVGIDGGGGGGRGAGGGGGGENPPGGGIKGPDGGRIAEGGTFAFEEGSARQRPVDGKGRFVCLKWGPLGREHSEKRDAGQGGPI